MPITASTGEAFHSQIAGEDGYRQGPGRQKSSAHNSKEPLVAAPHRN